MDEQHVFYHHEDAGPKISVKVERNSRGCNFEASVSGARSVDEAVNLLRQAEKELRGEYGQQRDGG